MQECPKVQQKPPQEPPPKVISPKGREQTGSSVNTPPACLHAGRDWHGLHNPYGLARGLLVGAGAGYHTLTLHQPLPLRRVSGVPRVMLTGLHTGSGYHCSTTFHVYHTVMTVQLCNSIQLLILNYEILDFIRQDVVWLYLTQLWFPLVERVREGDALRGRARGDALRQRTRGNTLR